MFISWLFYWLLLFTPLAVFCLKKRKTKSVSRKVPTTGGKEKTRASVMKTVEKKKVEKVKEKKKERKKEESSSDSSNSTRTGKNVSQTTRSCRTGADKSRRASKEKMVKSEMTSKAGKPEKMETTDKNSADGDPKEKSRKSKGKKGQKSGDRTKKERTKNEKTKTKGRGSRDLADMPPEVAELVRKGELLPPNDCATVDDIESQWDVPVHK